MLNLYRVRTLQQVATHGGISAAAEALHFTPSAVSQQIASLEAELGTPVLERVGRGVRLTEAGRVLLQHADGLLGAEAAARAAVERTRRSGGVTLRVGVFASVAAGLMPTLFERLAEAAPWVRLVTREVDPDTAVRDLRQDRLDLTFLLDYPEAPETWSSDVELSYVGTDSMVVALPERGDPVPVDPDGAVDLADLSRRDWILAGNHTYVGRAIRAACRRAGFDPHVVHQVDEQATALALVGAGLGVTLVSEFGRPFLPEQALVRPLTRRVTRRLLLAHTRASAERPAVRVLLDVASRAMREMRDQDW